MGFAKWFDEQSKTIRVVLLIPIWGGIIGILYRIFKYIETKHTGTLVGAILEIVPLVGFIISLLDFIFMIVDNKFKFFVPEGENFGINDSAKEEKAEEATEAKAEEVKEEEKAEEAPAEENKEEKAE